MVSPSGRKAGAEHLKERGICSVRRACRIAGIARCAVRYRPRPRPEDEGTLRDEIKALAGRRKRYGYRRITAVLRRKGFKVNHKRVHRIWKEEGLALRRRRKKRRNVGPKTSVVHKAERPDQVWSYDFVEDRTERGGRLKMLAVIDEYTRESLAIRVDRSIDSGRVIETLTDLFERRGVPEYIRSDNGPEFIACALRQWLRQSRCRTIYIEPGSPWENSYIESFIGKFRDECLNMEVFRNGREARVIVESWRREYNQLRPHSSLGYQTPAEYAALAVSSSRATPSLRLQPNAAVEKTLTLSLD